MDLFERLTDNDKRLIKDYLYEYAGNGGLGVELEHYLRFWSQGKENFYKMFGEKFILEKEVVFEQSTDEIAIEISNMMMISGVVRCFRSDYWNAVRRYFDYDSSIYYKLLTFTDNHKYLAENIYDGETFEIPASWTVNNRSLKIQHGAKISRMLGKIVKALGIEKDIWVCDECGQAYYEEGKVCYCGNKKIRKSTNYEEFRRLHSLCLNQKKVKGTLCLSIHPLDFMTMSDNDSGWASCMAWMDEPGEFRLGTVEMMNSSCVVIAYLKADHDMKLFYRNDEDTWNNKRWRQLFIVRPEMILGNKQYPYSNNEIQGTCMTWLRELVSRNPEYGPYNEEMTTIINSSINTLGPNLTSYIRISTNYMYNDVYGEKSAFINNAFFEKCENYFLNFSGEAVCVNCGQVIEPDTVSASQLSCANCNGSWQCWNCGEWHCDDDPSYDVEGHEVCEYCYDNEFSYCDLCDDTVIDTEEVYFIVPNAENGTVKYFNWLYSMRVCSHCIDNWREDLFGPLSDTEYNRWCTHKTIDIRNITDKGFDELPLSRYTIELMMGMRDASTEEEMATLIKENGF